MKGSGVNERDQYGFSQRCGNRSSAGMQAEQRCTGHSIVASITHANFVDACSVRSTNVRYAACARGGGPGSGQRAPGRGQRANSFGHRQDRRPIRYYHQTNLAKRPPYQSSSREFVMGFLHQLCQDTALPSRLPFIVLAEQLVQNVQQGIHVARFRFSSVRMMERFPHFIKIINSAA